MKRAFLGDIAEDFAMKHVVGDKSNVDYMEMLKYYPENDAGEFTNGWCCAFIYHCCREAGLDLPLGTHKTARKGHFRWFTSAIAWYEWAQMNGFTNKDSRDFVPERGDIVIYNNIIPEDHKQEDSLWCDHVGIVLACNGETLTVAEGNVGNQNVSGIQQRNRDTTIGCYVRIPEDFVSDELIHIPNNVYFIWGSGKTTAANELARRYGYYVYHTDDSRVKHFKNADPQLHPALCRDVPDVFALTPEDALQWEHAIVREMTPMIVADLTELAAKKKAVICEGDIDVDLIAPLTTHIIYISNVGKGFDFFDRLEQRHMLDEIRNRTDLTEADKEQRIKNAYAIVDGGKSAELPREVTQLGVKRIVRDDNTTVLRTAAEISAYFRFDVWYHGSPLCLTELAPGSAITRWKELAEAFSHKPTRLEYDCVNGDIRHNGEKEGILYIIDERLLEGEDIVKHPRSSMDDGVEWLTRRRLRLKWADAQEEPK